MAQKSRSIPAEVQKLLNDMMSSKEDINVVEALLTGKNGADDFEAFGPGLLQPFPNKRAMCALGGCNVFDGEQLQALWSPASANVTLLLFYGALLLLGIVANIAILIAMHVLHFRSTEIATICLFSNAVCDCLLALLLMLTDIALPTIHLTLLPFVCRFRNYFTHVFTSANSLSTAGLLLMYKKGGCVDVLSTAPCGLFIFPAFLGFICLAGNVWLLVLFECRPLVFTLNGTSVGRVLDGVAVGIDIMQADIPSAWLVICVTTSIMIGAPLIVCCGGLLRALMKSGEASERKRAYTGAALHILHVLLTPTSFVVSTIGIYNQLMSHNMQVSFIVATLVGRLLFAMQFILKPLACAILYKDVFKAALSKRRQSRDKAPALKQTKIVPTTLESPDKAVLGNKKDLVEDQTKSTHLIARHSTQTSHQWLTPPLMASRKGGAPKTSSSSSTSSFNAQCSFLETSSIGILTDEECGCG